MKKGKRPEVQKGQKLILKLNMNDKIQIKNDEDEYRSNMMIIIKR